MCVVGRLGKLVCVGVCARGACVTWLRTSNTDILENCICFSQVFFLLFHPLRATVCDHRKQMFDSELHPSIWHMKVYRSRGGRRQLKLFFWPQSEWSETG